MLGLLPAPLFLSMPFLRWSGGMHAFWSTQKAMHPLQTLTGEAICREHVSIYHMSAYHRYSIKPFCYVIKHIQMSAFCSVSQLFNT